MGAHLITMAMAPAPGGGCSISYDHVTTWKETCEQVALGPFRDFKRRGALHRDVLQLERESLLHVSLLPAAAGCVSLKREVMYFGG